MNIRVKLMGAKKRQAPRENAVLIFKSGKITIRRLFSVSISWQVR